METVNCMLCDFRHKDNGNCTAVGGFCTAVPAAHCPMLRTYLNTGCTPEECANAVNIIRIAFSDDTSKAERIRKLLKADEEGRLVVLPAKTVYELVWDAGQNCDGICPVAIDGVGSCDFCNAGELCIYEVPCKQEHIERIGDDVFLTYEEAENGLEKLKNG